MSKLVDFFKKHSLSALTSVLTSNPAPVALSIISSLVGADDVSEEAILEKLNTDPATLVRMKELSLEAQKIRQNGINAARQLEIDILQSGHATQFNKNFKGIFAILILVFIFAILVLHLILGAKISDFVVGSVLGYGLSVISYYFGSSDESKK